MNSLPVSAAAERNKRPILEQLQRLLPASARVLEIGSGWAQHAVYFCSAMPGLDWQPSERGGELPIIEKRVAAEGGPGIRPPIALDVLEDPWPAGPFDAVYSANTAHIMPWEAVLAMLQGVGGCLQPGGLFALYGPFNIGGAYTAASNAAFDRNLRAQDAAMGIRDMEVLEKAAARHQLHLEEQLPMPANNFLLVFRKRPPN